MSRDELQKLTQCVVELSRRLSAEPRLAAELQRARRQFFGDVVAGQRSSAGDDAAEHRFAEWFLLERDSETLGAVPASLPGYRDAAQDLEDSVVGAFLVRVQGGIVTAHDVQDETVYEIADEGRFAAGDLIVGRMFPVSDDRWVVSAAAPVLRPGEDVAAAFARDLERLSIERRLQQIELEHLLLHGRPDAAVGALAAEPSVPLEHLEADLERLLREAGNLHSATAISQQLALVERPGPLLGPLLDQLAFDTDVDLERARQLMLGIWNAHHSGARPSTEAPDDLPSGPPGETLGERLVRMLDEGLAQKRDVEDLFQQLERMAGIDGDDDEEDEDDGEHDGDDAFDDDLDDDEEHDGARRGAAFGDGDEGDLGPLVTEYLWETGRSEDPAAAPLLLWAELQQNAPVPHTDIESVAAGDVMRLLLHVYLRAAPTQRAANVRAAFGELRSFYDWVVATQEIDRRAVLDECHGVLLEQLDRLESAGRELSDAGKSARGPGILEVEDLGPVGFGARDDDGGHHWLSCSAEAARLLRVGDLVLGGLGAQGEGGERRLAGLVVVLPTDARALIE